LEGDSLVDAVEQKMAVLKYGEGPGIVAKCAAVRV
jgi:hypothetical protein